ncbi:MAG TPA: CaiB/BaiF CoA-transferase family protein [Acidimicrobiales bacterium]|jgi:alpha-methylacyl-CoA racemase|nr:CaiB/BaiF CoA-transferase family protein [Acidimicrobiales bacterium]
MPGPLSGYRVIELAGLGPAPFGAMMLADMGADVIRVDRPDAVMSYEGVRPPQAAGDVLGRGRRSVAIDLKHPDGPATILNLVEEADVLLEGFRPGVAERLGVGPEPCLARNPRLIYGRMTGWGQDGPQARRAGHDINYLALSGTLSLIGRRDEPPVPPLNLVADFGGGGLMLAFGVVCALLEASRSGQGQVIDAAMVDGAALLATMIHGLRGTGWWRDERGTNLLDTGAWFYEVYETADGGFVAVGALEPKFFAELVRITGLGDELPAQYDTSTWPEMKGRLAEAFKTKTRDEWCALLEPTDACVAPVLGLGEAPTHPHNQARQTFTTIAGVVQPAPAPRLSRTPGEIRRPPPRAGQDTAEVLADWGFDQSQIDRLKAAGAIKEG